MINYQSYINDRLKVLNKSSNCHDMKLLETFVEPEAITSSHPSNQLTLLTASINERKSTHNYSRNPQNIAQFKIISL